MSLCKKYRVVGWYETIHRLTANQLCKRIKKDSQSDYNWIAPARELVRICKLPDFPVECSLVIKVAILNCFANIENRANRGGDRYYTNPDDANAVEYCYNSLYGNDSEEAISARKSFLTQMITSASDIRILDPHYHPGPTFRKLREDWIKSTFEEYIPKKNINFRKLTETSEKSFLELIKKAESEGSFEEDEKKLREQETEFWAFILPHLHDI